MWSHPRLHHPCHGQWSLNSCTLQFTPLAPPTLQAPPTGTTLCGGQQPAGAIRAGKGWRRRRRALTGNCWSWRSLHTCGHKSTSQSVPPPCWPRSVITLQSVMVKQQRPLALPGCKPGLVGGAKWTSTTQQTFLTSMGQSGGRTQRLKTNQKEPFFVFCSCLFSEPRLPVRLPVKLSFTLPVKLAVALPVRHLLT